MLSEIYARTLSLVLLLEVMDLTSTPYMCPLASLRILSMDVVMPGAFEHSISPVSVLP